MKCRLIFSFLGLLCFGGANAQSPAQSSLGTPPSFNKFDSTLKTGKVGYRVDCRNQHVGLNQLTVRPVGFSGEAREMSFMVMGRVAKAEIDDLNGDGFPDLVIYIYSDSVAMYGTVYAFLSEANKSIATCALPDVMLDGKLNTGYKGHDQFSLMESYVQQKFPIYKTGDEKDKPTGGTRVVLYQMTKGDEGRFKFTRIRFYDTQ